MIKKIITLILIAVIVTILWKIDKTNSIVTVEYKTFVVLMKLSYIIAVIVALWLITILLVRFTSRITLKYHKKKIKKNNLKNQQVIDDVTYLMKEIIMNQGVILDETNANNLKKKLDKKQQVNLIQIIEGLEQLSNKKKNNNYSIIVNKDYEDYCIFLKGVKLLEMKDYVLSKSCFEYLYDKYPKYVAVIRYFLQTCIKMNAYQDAIKVIQEMDNQSKKIIRLTTEEEWMIQAEYVQQMAKQKQYARLINYVETIEKNIIVLIQNKQQIENKAIIFVRKIMIIYINGMIANGYKISKILDFIFQYIKILHDDNQIIHILKNILKDYSEKEVNIIKYIKDDDGELYKLQYIKAIYLYQTGKYEEAQIALKLYSEKSGIDILALYDQYQIVS